MQNLHNLQLVCYLIRHHFWSLLIQLLNIKGFDALTSKNICLVSDSQESIND